MIKKLVCFVAGLLLENISSKRNPHLDLYEKTPEEIQEEMMLREHFTKK